MTSQYLMQFQLYFRTNFKYFISSQFTKITIIIYNAFFYRCVMSGSLWIVIHVVQRELGMFFILSFFFLCGTAGVPVHPSICSTIIQMIIFHMNGTLARNLEQYSKDNCHDDFLLFSVEEQIIILFLNFDFLHEFEIGF